MKAVYKLSLSALLVSTLAACSGGDSRRQAADDFKYLETPPLTQWQTLPDQQAELSGAYRVPTQAFDGPIGRNVDIRPPQQILELVPGARYERDADSVSVWVPRQDQLQRLWQTVETMQQSGQLPTRTASPDGIETDWVEWAMSDDDEVIESRYLITPVEDRGRYGLRVQLVEWKRDGAADNVTAGSKDRANAQMTNLITAQYDAELREEARLRAQELVKNIPISLGNDRSGLPVIIARAPYEVFWERLPAILGELGFTIEDRNRSQGLLTVDYKSDDDHLEALGVEPLQLDKRKYTVLLGDLGNRTSINLTDSAGKPVSEEALASLAPAMTAAVEALNSH